MIPSKFDRTSYSISWKAILVQISKKLKNRRFLKKSKMRSIQWNKYVEMLKKKKEIHLRIKLSYVNQDGQAMNGSQAKGW